MAKASDQDEMHRLYCDHNRWLHGWLRVRLGDSDRAADIAQDVFVRLLIGAVSHPLREPRSYLATVAKRVMVDHFRRRTLEQNYLKALASQPVLYECSAEERVLMLEALLLIDAMFDGLDRKAREAFLLAQFDGLSYIEIARRLRVSVSSVTKYIAKATEQCLLYIVDAQA